MVRSLGQRHAKYAVTDAQFAKMKEVLLWTLEQMLGSAFTPETREAWSAAYDNLADMIQRSMRQPDASANAGPGADVFARAGIESGIELVNSGRADLVADFFKRTGAV